MSLEHIITLFTFAGDASATTLLSHLSELVNDVQEVKISLDDALESSTLCQIQSLRIGVPQCKNTALLGCGCSIREWFQFYGHSSDLHV